MNFFLDGLKLITQPGLRQYVVIPIGINVMVLSGVIAYGVSQYDAWTTAFTDSLPSWLMFLSGVFSVLAALLVLIIMLYLFTIVANIISAPFNAVLSIKIEQRETGRTPGGDTGLVVILVRSLAREMAKLIYFLPRVIGLVIVTVIPGVNTLAPFLWLLFGAWMMSIQYVDYAADNNEVSFNDMRRLLERERVQTVTFGLIVYVALAVPVLNLVLIPAAVAGGTLFWVHRLGRAPLV
ncbi:MAG: sulfate transporter CysZ [Pseudomonadales bacterium]